MFQHAQLQHTPFLSYQSTSVSPHTAYSFPAPLRPAPSKKREKKNTDMDLRITNRLCTQGKGKPFGLFVI